MLTAWCSADDIYEIYPELQADVTRQVVPIERVTAAIEAATLAMQVRLSTLWNIADIEADSALPPQVIYATAADAALRLLNAQGAENSAANDEFRRQLQLRHARWVANIQQGLLFAADGRTIEPKTQVVAQTNLALSAAIDREYANGPRSR